ncbi:LOG family protein, partial [Staphylococcus epidermidis]|uniref:LOG family protein n=1 Tax=Staphylococcus epidermidis TaxID=1282 RepID=UPI0037D9FC03
MAQQRYHLLFPPPSLPIIPPIQHPILHHRAKPIPLIPKILRKPQITTQKLTHLILLHSIHQPKNKITELPHPFIIPPPPPPSLQQFFQMYTSPQIPMHQNPIPLFNLNP